MAVLTYQVEVNSRISPPSLFKAMILDIETLLPKIFPQAITSFVTLQGDGGPGTIKQVNLSNGKHVKEITDTIDKDNFKYAYSVIEGDALVNSLEKICIEITFEPAMEGGSICKRSSKYFTIRDVDIKEEEEIKAIHVKAAEFFTAIFKAFEVYLLANPGTVN